METEGEVVRAGFERKYLVPESAAERLLQAIATCSPPTRTERATAWRAST